MLSAWQSITSVAVKANAVSNNAGIVGYLALHCYAGVYIYAMSLNLSRVTRVWGQSLADLDPIPTDKLEVLLKVCCASDKLPTSAGTGYRHVSTAVTDTLLARCLPRDWLPSTSVDCQLCRPYSAESLALVQTSPRVSGQGTQCACCPVHCCV